MGDGIEPAFNGVKARGFAAQNGQDQHRPFIGDLFKDRACAVDFSQQGRDIGRHKVTFSISGVYQVRN